MDDLKEIWKSGQNNSVDSNIPVDEIISQAGQKKKKALKVQITNLVILVLVLIGLCLFFKYVTPFEQLLSKVGVALMLGSLSVRIILEIYSIILSGNVDVSETALKSNTAAFKYHKFRKFIHGFVTISILVIYSVGFFMLTPEFSLYFNSKVMILIDLSFLIAALIVGLSIRSAIRREMASLNDIVRFNKELLGK